MRPLPPAPPRFPALGGAMVLVSIAFGLVFLALAVIVWWRICAKAGYSGALGLLMFVPLANVILLLVLAFGTWPIEEEVRRLLERDVERLERQR